MITPKQPSPGDPILASFAKTQTDHARASTLRGSAGCRVSEGSSGTTIFMPRQAIDRSDRVRDSFEPWMEGDTVYVASGYRKLVGADPVKLEGAEPDGSFAFAWAAGKFIYTVFTYSTPDADGSFDETLNCDASPPSSDNTREVTILAEMVQDRGWADVRRRHFGDVVIEDKLVCVDCPGQAS